MIIDQQNVVIGTFSDNSFYIASHGAAINFLFWTSFFFFRLFYLSTRFRCYDRWIFCHLLGTYLVSVLLAASCAFFGCYECWLPCISRVMCHTRRELQLEEQFLRKYFLVCTRNESDLGHTLSWWLILKRWLKSFWQSRKRNNDFIQLGPERLNFNNFTNMQ